MIGPPRDKVKKKREEEMARLMINEIAKGVEVGSGTYSSFKTKTQGATPGFAKRTPTQKPLAKKDPIPTPAPGGSGKVFSSFSKKGCTSFSNTKRFDEKYRHGDKTPGVGQYTINKPKRTRSALITQRGSHSRLSINRDLTIDSDRSGWNQTCGTPGPGSYESPNRGRISHRSSRAKQTLGGTSRKDFALAFDGATTAGPGDYTLTSDFDISKRTFNTYAREQSIAKTRAASPSPHRRPRSVSPRPRPSSVAFRGASDFMMQRSAAPPPASNQVEIP